MSFHPAFPIMRSAALSITSCRNLTDIEAVLDIPKRKLKAHADKPEYHTFNLLKHDGSYRRIEAPNHYLKDILKNLNFFLQSAYYIDIPDASYGYVLCPENTNDPRNIKTNAKHHLGCKYMLNVDFEDFFHQFSTARVREIFSSFPFHFSDNVSALLADLCTYHGRLPMGSPTSPVLSNLGLMGLDKDVQDWADSKSINYTRFVDDLSFSSTEYLDKNILTELQPIFDKHRFTLNPEKTILYGELDTKIVTGIVVGEQLSIQEDFYYELSQDLKRLRMTVESSVIMEGSQPCRFVRKCKQQVSGKINFVKSILGSQNEKVKKYEKEYQEAVNPNIQRLSMRWTDFPYT